MPSHMVEASKPSKCLLCGRLVRADVASPARAATPMRAEWRNRSAARSRPMVADSYFDIAMRVLPAMRRSSVASTAF
jgi:hypothetical protein